MNFKEKIFLDKGLVKLLKLIDAYRLNSNIEIYFHRTTLKEADFYPEIGDIVYWNEFYWEINSTMEPQLIAGHQGYKHQIKAMAHRTRISNVTLEERPR